MSSQPPKKKFKREEENTETSSSSSSHMLKVCLETLQKFQGDIGNSLKIIRNLLELYYQEDIILELEPEEIGQALKNWASKCDLEKVISSPEIQFLLFKEKLIAPLQLELVKKRKEQTLTDDEDFDLSIQAEADQSAYYISFAVIILLSRLASSNLKQQKNAIQRLVDLNTNYLVRKSCKEVLRKCLIKLLEKKHLRTDLLDFGILEAIGYHLNLPEEGSGTLLEFVESLTEMEWKNQSLESLSSIIEHYLIPLLDLGLPSLVEPKFPVIEKICTTPRFKDSLNNLSKKHASIHFLACRLAHKKPLPPIVCSLLKTWLTLPEDDPIRKKHVWAILSEKTKNRLKKIASQA